MSNVLKFQQPEPVSDVDAWTEKFTAKLMASANPDSPIVEYKKLTPNEKVNLKESLRRQYYLGKGLNPDIQPDAPSSRIKHPSHEPPDPQTMTLDEWAIVLLGAPFSNLSGLDQERMIDYLRERHGIIDI